MPHQLVSASHVSDFVTTHQDLLLAAHENWNDVDLVTEQDTEIVKAVVRQVFGITGELSGWRAEDALVFTKAKDESTWYAIHFKENTILWIKAEDVRTSNVWFDRDQGLELILFFLNSQVEEEEEDPQKLLLSDFFDYWRRHFSLDRIPRVTGRKDSAAKDKPIPRNAESLERMRWEASMLGFDAQIRGDELNISWVDPEAIEKYGVPTIACISADSGESRGYTRHPEDPKEEGFDWECWASDAFTGQENTDYEAWACYVFNREVHGFYIEEYYGPNPIFVKTWGKWDDYLQGCMWPPHDNTPFKNKLSGKLLEEVLPLCENCTFIAEPIVARMFEAFKGELNPICSMVNNRWRHGLYSPYSIRRMTFQMEAELIELLVATGAAVV